MATQMRIEFDSNGFREVLESGEVNALVAGQAAEIQARANANTGQFKTEGFGTKVLKGGYGGGRWIAHVFAIDYGARAAEAENKALTKAVK